MMLTKLPSSAATSWLLSIAILTTPAVVAQRAAINVPESIHQASDLGRIDSAQEINVTVRLNMRDQDDFHKVVDALYEPGSPTFHKWLTDEELKRYAPAEGQTDAVRKELESHGLTILSTDENGFSIRARGSAANIERAFNTEIHQFQRNGKVFRANVRNVRLTGAAGDYVSTVTGIENHQVHPLLKRAVNPRTNEPPPAIALKKMETSGGLGAYITNQFLSAPTAFTFPTPGSALPIGVYFGNVYNESTTLISDYTPTQLQAIYGLPAAYKKGLDGTGQTIVLLEAYGYPTIEADANAFFNLAGLPPLTSSNFKVIYPEGKPANPDLGILTGWDVEIALDVQWAHSIAPGAKILVVAAPGQDNEDLQAAMSYIVDHRLGYSISDSWEADLDISAGPLENESFDQILEVAAAKGISFHFSTGDSGDNGLGNPIGAAGVPSNSPHATAIGGTSILNKIYGSGSETLGWGTGIVQVNQSGVFDPPLVLPFYGGSGGGESVFFPKPFWQKGLPGTGRQTPDVSALADPYTGVPIVVTYQGAQYLFAGYGGTSLASPIFTAIWAIANQKAGHPLGQAAPAIAGLKAGQLLDVLPESSPTNVAGTIFDSTGATFYSPTDLFTGLLYNTTEFTSALWNAGGGNNYAVSFGLDTSLTVTKGWDNVTGYGTPNGLAFLDAVAK